MSWTLKNVPDYDPSIHGQRPQNNNGGSSGGGGTITIPPELLSHVKNKAIHLNANQRIKINNAIDTKDITYSIPGTIKLGAQKDTEFFFPYTGKIDEVIISISTNSSMNTNLVIGFEKLNGRTWSNLTQENYIFQIGERYKAYKTENDPIISNEVIRVNLRDGNFEEIELLNIILKVKEVINNTITPDPAT